MTEFSQKLQELRSKLPAGAIKQIAPTQGQKVRLGTMWGKESLDDMTPGEKEMYDRVLEYRAKMVAEDEERERKLNALIK